MDAITFLKNDHKTVEQLFKRFEHAGDRAYVEKRQIVDRIIEELSQHAAVEELVFYPVTRATVDGVEHMALESLEEHHIVKWLLEELSDLDPSHERFDAKVTVLMENVRHHVKEEEGDYFPKVRHELGRTALGDLGEAMADAKETAPTHPHPRGADTPPGNVVTGAVTGVVDRVGDTVSGIAQGSVTVLQELIADHPHEAPGGVADRIERRPQDCPPGACWSRNRRCRQAHGRERYSGCQKDGPCRQGRRQGHRNDRPQVGGCNRHDGQASGDHHSPHRGSRRQEHFEHRQAGDLAHQAGGDDGGLILRILRDASVRRTSVEH